jgi:hypothetical protein
MKHWKIFFKLAIAGFFALIFFILLKHSFDYLDPDLGWHLKFGQEIVVNRDVPRINLVNYTIFQRPWVDHEWLSNLLSFIIFDFFGYIGLNIFFALLALSAFLLQFLTAKRFFFPKDSSGLLIFFALSAFAVFASLPSLGVRMQEFTLLFLALLLFIMYGYERRGDVAALFLLPPLMYFWSCLHGGFVLGLGILFIFPSVKLFEFFLSKSKLFFFLEKKLISLRKIIYFYVAAIASAVATFFTPYGGELYSFLTSYGNDFYLERIFEWFHQFRYPFFYPQLVFFQLLFLILGWWAIRVFFLRRPTKTGIGFFEAAMFLMFSLMALRSRRHFPLLAMFSVPLLASLVAEYVGLKFKSWPERLSCSKVVDIGLKAFLISVLIVASAVFLAASDINSDPWRNYQRKYPYAAVEFLKSHPEYSQGRLFNEFNWGGYLIWVWPGKELFIDGRLPQMEYKGHSLLEEFYEFSVSGRAEKKLDEYGIDLVLLSAKEDRVEPAWYEKKLLGIGRYLEGGETESFLVQFLSSSLNWELVYNDEVAKVFVRKK